MWGGIFGGWDGGGGSVQVHYLWLAAVGRGRDKPPGGLTSGGHLDKFLAVGNAYRGRTGDGRSGGRLACL